ncbi:unnamed protein product [Chilo suppressalis]|uniref:Peptide-N(4)-(N-acetyl-beta-glucosaminyl)asparagine amidase n=1 Tax=Chilo suppressalis TaxID=168631 RepID=A0ABN8AXV4_CHISP|nr:unnamed protein product [Chilo suppressalis]
MEDTARLALVEQYIRDSENFTKVLYELLRLINIILENPHDYELRTFKSDLLNTYVKSEVFQEYLKYIGFEIVDNQMSYPKEQTLSKLRIAQATIERKIEFCCGTLNTNSVKSVAKVMKPKLTPLSVVKSKNPLLLKIEALFNNMIQYENEKLQQIARDQIPIVSLQLKAIDRLREHQRRIKNGVIKTYDMPFDIAMLMELVNWYKFKFFKWVDKPECDKCKGQTKFVYNTSLQTQTEVCSVEVYSCMRCPNRVNFPRHNEPRTLLNTRRGRCGEWANCFTLLCRALGYDTRYVYDVTDHVWCEVFDYDSNTWLHVDPCEAKINAPLMYSHGWGKKLSYVIAVSRDDVQDVTWRYTTNHKEVLKRRNLCDEYELMSTLMLMRENRQKQVSAARRNYLEKRTAQELAQFLGERKPEDYEMHGRISGSKEWRTERGETGTASGHTFLFSKMGDISIEYFPVADEYRISGPEPGVIQTWSAGAFSATNILRKLEHDWQMVYLARTENDEDSLISWRIKATQGYIFSSLCVRASSATYQGGLVEWAIQFDGQTPETVQFGSQ